MPGDGEKHAGRGATGNLSCCNDRAFGLRLHCYAGTEKEALTPGR
jgi:hypothetical protein